MTQSVPTTRNFKGRTMRKSYARTPNVVELPRLIEIQLHSFRWFQSDGLTELFEEISPIVSFNKNLELHFGSFHFGEPKYPEEECRIRDITYSAPLWVKVRLVNSDTGEISEQEVFMGDFPLMTDSGTFIINGSERVVVSQLIRSPGAYFTVEEDRSTGRDLAGAKVIPGPRGLAGIRDQQARHYQRQSRPQTQVTGQHPVARDRLWHRRRDSCTVCRCGR